MKFFLVFLLHVFLKQGECFIGSGGSDAPEVSEDLKEKNTNLTRIGEATNFRMGQIFVAMLAGSLKLILGLLSPL